MHPVETGELKEELSRSFLKAGMDGSGSYLPGVLKTLVRHLKL